MAKYSIYVNNNGNYYYKTDANSRESAFRTAIKYCTDDKPVLVQWGDGEQYVITQKLKRGASGSFIEDYKYLCFVDVYDPEYTHNTKIVENAIYELNPETGRFIKKIKENAFPKRAPAQPSSARGSVRNPRNTNDWLIYGKEKGSKKFKVFTGEYLSDKIIYGLRWSYKDGDKVLKIVEQLNRDNPDYVFERRRGTSQMMRD